jgi:hypothetical protein
LATTSASSTAEHKQAARTGELGFAAAGAAAPTADGSAAVDAAYSQQLTTRAFNLLPPSAKSLEMFLFGRDSGISSTCEDKAGLEPAEPPALHPSLSEYLFVIIPMCTAPEDLPQSYPWCCSAKAAGLNGESVKSK